MFSNIPERNEPISS